MRPLAAYLRHIGKDATSLFTEAGIDPLGLLDPNASIPHPLLLDRWRRAEELCNDPNLGLRVLERIEVHAMARMQLETEWVVLQMFVVSATVGEGLARFAKYFPVSFYGSRIVVEHDGRITRVRHEVLGVREVPRGFSEFILGLVALQIHELAIRPVKPREIRFAHPAPASLADHERILPGPTRFLAGEDAIVLDAADLEVPMRAANEALLTGLERHAAQALSRLPALESLVDRVRALITAELPGGNPNADHIASALQMSVRTLARRLDELGTSHKALLDDVRAKLARSYLLEEKRSVNEVAGLLGFSEVSAFHRAFRRWFGQSPTDFCRDAGGPP
ncbi:AraC family transcriptional regulator [Polyangium spumosum]|uniref:AraC family transcriptional regulator n=1 Tax=Polyangium spumosum TaxID=889282 RepID=UPI001478EE3E|nr:AraC family transcriptional regulator [Polyangium spumosum]